MTEDNTENTVSDDEPMETANLDLPDEMFRGGVSEPETFSFSFWEKNVDGTFSVNEKDATFEEIDGDAFLEGDIKLGKATDIRESAIGLESRGIGIIGAEFRWQADQIHYVVADDNLLQHKVDLAITHWQKYTPIRFIKRTPLNEDTHDDYISFENRGACWSYVGRQGGEQVISIGDGCSIGSAIHEIGHALGLFHEQSRSDRDNFIEVKTANIKQAALHNFDKKTQGANDLGSYDFGSIMHYPPRAFSTNGQETIRTKNGQSIGQRNGLSKGDVESIKIMYSNLNWSNVTPIP